MDFIKFQFLDIIDIVIVALVIYYFLSFIKGTRAIQMLVGLAFILIIALVSDFLKFGTLSWIMSGFKAIWVVAFVILFQPEIRNALTRIGKTRIAKFITKREEEKALMNEIIEGTLMLKERGIGGLIVIAREIGLKTWIEKGTMVDARVSGALINTIFTPYSPLHDGAIIIKEDSIVAARCILPLSDSPTLDHTLGTRHRAALGLSEITDAVCICVSEEKSTVSMAINGKFMKNISKEKLQRELTGVF